MRQDNTIYTFSIKLSFSSKGQLLITVNKKCVECILNFYYLNYNKNLFNTKKNLFPPRLP